MKYTSQIICLTLANVISLLGITQFTQQGYDIDGEAAGDRSGTSVDLSADGNTLAIGATINNGGAPIAGHTRIYHWSGTTWAQKGLDIDGEVISDWSGYAVNLSLDGNIVAIGAINNDANAVDAGNVRIFSWDGSEWSQMGATIYGDFGNDFSGWAVELSLDGNTIAIGAPSNNGNGLASGQVRIFSWDGSSWVQKGIDLLGESADDQFGRAISVSSNGDVVAIGAPFNDGTGTDAGHVRVFYWNGFGWSPQGGDINGEAVGDNFGAAIHINGDGSVLAVGATKNDDSGVDAGHTRVFDWDGSDWIQRGMDIDGESADDNSGNSIELSANGNTIAIGAPNNDGTGTDAGHVRVFKWDGANWTQHGNDIDGEFADDLFGYSVSLNDDGSTLAIGGRGNDGNGANSGHVRVYNDPSVINNIESNNSQFKIKIYPNPASHFIIISGLSDESYNSISVSNSIGQIVAVESLWESEAKFDISNLANGVYMLEISREGKFFVKRIILSR